MVAIVFPFNILLPQLDFVTIWFDYYINLGSNGVLNDCQQVNDVGLFKITLPSNLGNL